MPPLPQTVPPEPDGRRLHLSLTPIHPPATTPAPAILHDTHAFPHLDQYRYPFIHSQPQLLPISQRPVLTTRPPVPLFPDGDRRPITAPPGARPPSLDPHSTRVTGFTGGDVYYGSSQYQSSFQPFYIPHQPQHISYGQLTSSRHYYPPSSTSTYQGPPPPPPPPPFSYLSSSSGDPYSFQHDQRLSEATAIPLNAGISARRHTFPRHIRPDLFVVHNGSGMTTPQTPPQHAISTCPTPPPIPSHTFTSLNHGQSSSSTILIPPPRPQHTPSRSQVSTTSSRPPPPSRLPADHSTCGVSGFQADYVRPSEAETRRPIISLEPDSPPGLERPLSQGGSGLTFRVPPPPTEAFVILRNRTEPRGGWPAMAVPEGSDWTVELEIIQEPTKGMSIGLADPSQASPILDPSLVFRVSFFSQGQPVSDNHQLVAKRVAYMTLHLCLVSAETGKDIAYIRYNTYPGDEFASDTSEGSTASEGRFSYVSSSSSDNTQFSGPTTTLFCLVGPTFGVAKLATSVADQLEGGWYFTFPDLRIRPKEIFRLEAKLIDILGPGPSGTSTGIMPIAATVITSPFRVFARDQYPGTDPPTSIAVALAAQGLMSRQKRPRVGSRESSSEEESE